MYNIKGIPAEHVEGLWRFAEPFIKRALDHTFGEVSAEDLKKMCLARNAQLWMAQKENRIIGAGITTIIDYPQMKVCRIITISGSDFDEWKDMCCMHIECWAEAQGCVAMEAYVRRGFVPKLLEIGFRHRYSVVHKSLKGK